MNTALLTFLLRAENAAAPTDMQGQAGTAGAMVSYLVMMAIVFGLMYFLMIRPQKKKEKEQQQESHSAHSAAQSGKFHEASIKKRSK